MWNGTQMDGVSCGVFASAAVIHFLKGARMVVELFRMRVGCVCIWLALGVFGW
jgi:hypothetical protein